MPLALLGLCSESLGSVVRRQLPLRNLSLPSLRYSQSNSYPPPNLQRTARQVHSSSFCRDSFAVRLQRDRNQQLVRPRKLATMAATSQNATSSSAPSPLPHAVGTTMGNFKLQQSFTLPYAPDMRVQKWKSEKTGLTLIWADFQSPLLNAYMTVPTEIFTDSGVPHTLEHLIFLGSQDYPYKGILDSLANRSFASGTNAWTANDHTAYTLTTASSDGFLRMLPVYADHLFRPTLTDAGFVTEVYHINGKGQDAGVVFSEMQGRENSSGSVIELRNQRSLYPVGNAYRSETGGLMEKLRILTVQEIRDYHAKYYAPHNTALIITGPLPAQGLLEAVNGIDEALIAAGKAPGPEGPPGWSRPFLTTGSAKQPVIDGTEAGDLPSLFPVDKDGSPREQLRRKTTVEFPEEDESTGELCISWVGAKYGTWLEEEAIGVLSTYLTDSAVSPIQKEFVERDEPLCTDVYLSSEAKAGRCTLSAYFVSVPTEKLEALDRELVTLLEKIVAEGIDAERMALCIRRDRIKLLDQLETKPSDSFADVLIAEHLYGDAQGGTLAVSMDDMKRYDELATWTSKQWTDLIQKWYIANPRLVVIGKPSKSLAKTLKKETKALEAKRKRELGDEGLKQKEQLLEAARKENDRTIPEEILSGFRIPSEDSIIWIQNGKVLVGEKPQTGRHAALPPSTSVAKAELDEQLEQHLQKTAAGETLPFPVQFVQVPSAFVTISLVFPTSKLPSHLRPLMHLYLATFFLLPIKRNGAVIPYEEVVRGLDEDTVEYEGGMGVGGAFGENACIELKVEKAKYQRAVQWLQELVWSSVFVPERLKVSAAKTTQGIPEQKRDGQTIASALSRAMTHELSQSTNTATSILSLIDTMPALNAELASEPQKVVDRLEEIRSTVFQPSNVIVSVGGDVCGVEQPLAPWRGIPGASGATKAGQLCVPWSQEVLTPLGKTPSKKGVICSLPTIESSYAVWTAKGLDNFEHPDNAALTVSLAMLNALESPLWRYVRGAGLAYGASIRSTVESSHLRFTLYRSPDSSKAFAEARKVILALADPSSPDAHAEAGAGLVLDQVMLDSAKSLLHFSVAESEGTVAQSAAEVFMDEIMRGTGRGRGRRLLESVGRVTLDDCRRVLKEYVLPLFDPKTSICAIASAPSRVNEMQKALETIGYEMERRDLVVTKEDEEAGSDEESGSESGTESASESEEGSEEDSDDASDSDVEMTEPPSDAGSEAGPKIASGAASTLAAAFAPPSTVQKLALSTSGATDAVSTTLDDIKPAFARTVQVMALRVHAKDVGALRSGGVGAPKAMLGVPRISPIAKDPAGADDSAKLLLLHYGSEAEVPAAVRTFAQSKGYQLVSHEISIGFDYFSADEVMSALLPQDEGQGTPTGYTTIGHIAHLNLRDEYLPYRRIIGQIILEKNSGIRTVVNKLDTIDNEFRFFEMELLAGEADYVTTVSEQGCQFTFDFRKVYFNSRLHTEHARVVSLFEKGDVIADVMAGVGPFALPAAKKGCVVYANDLNPASYESLAANAERNRLSAGCKSSCLDGRAFIRESVSHAWAREIPSWAGPKSSKQRALEERAAKGKAAATTSAPATAAAQAQLEVVPSRLVDHFVMNLPASALDFLDAYRGLYARLSASVGRETLQAEMAAKGKGKGKTQAEGKSEDALPTVHVHCFTKDMQDPSGDICRRANAALGIPHGHVDELVSPEEQAGARTQRPRGTQTALHWVRKVAPNKDMYCLSFALPRSVLFDE